MVANSERSDIGSPIKMDVASPDGPTDQLEYLFDDHAAPTELTIFDPDTLNNGATEWITIDHESSVPLDEIR